MDRGAGAIKPLIATVKVIGFVFRTHCKVSFHNCIATGCITACRMAVTALAWVGWGLDRRAQAPSAVTRGNRALIVLLNWLDRTLPLKCPSSLVKPSRLSVSRISEVVRQLLSRASSNARATGSVVGSGQPFKSPLAARVGRGEGAEGRHRQVSASQNSEKR